MSLIVNFYKYLEHKPLNLWGTRILRAGIGIVVLFETSLSFSQAGFLYGSDGISTIPSSDSFGLLGSYVDIMFRSDLGVYLFLMVRGLGALGLILNIMVYPSTLINMFGYFFEGAIAVNLDGGDNIASILLVYSLLLVVSPRPGLPKARIFLHNVGIAAIYAQVAILYFVSGTAKLGGEVWMNGTALYYVLQTNTFAPPFPWVAELFKNPWVVTTSVYTTIVYQVGFPFMLLNKLHLLWVALGVVLHLGIAVVMGLVSFSLMMIVVILFTVRDSEWTTITYNYGRLPFIRKPPTGHQI